MVLLLGNGPARAGLPSPHLPGSSAQEDPAVPSVTNEWCPVLTDERVDPEIHTTFRGEQVYLCCRKCLKQFRADPAAYVDNLPALASLGAAQDSGGGESDHGEHLHPQETEAMEMSADAEQHDHADHGDGDASEGSGLIPWLGRFHPMVVHFPIALLLMAAAAELVLMFAGAKHFAFAARFCLWGGALGALVAAPLGWADALSVEDDYVGLSARLLFFHRWGGTATALVAGLALFACERSRRSNADSWKRRYRALLFLCALLVAAAGHLGASLIYGWEYLSW